MPTPDATLGDRNTAFSRRTVQLSRFIVAKRRQLRCEIAGHALSIFQRRELVGGPTEIFKSGLRPHRCRRMLTDARGVARCLQWPLSAPEVSGARRAANPSTGGRRYDGLAANQGIASPDKIASDHDFLVRKIYGQVAARMPVGDVNSVTFTPSTTSISCVPVTTLFGRYSLGGAPRAPAACAYSISFLSFSWAMIVRPFGKAGNPLT
jgi:hypothetical protein